MIPLCFSSRSNDREIFEFCCKSRTKNLFESGGESPKILILAIANLSKG
ncbi:MAG: hypothetical protein HC899_01470 [Leptolyngbyaceae cyanobacterium SM1_4_3]|nr:hypothetical protein [Leptolyngbyaceae cyanobacterium SM1_4_3]